MSDSGRVIGETAEPHPDKVRLDAAIREVRQLSELQRQAEQERKRMKARMARRQQERDAQFLRDHQHVGPLPTLSLQPGQDAAGGFVVADSVPSSLTNSPVSMPDNLADALGAPAQPGLSFQFATTTDPFDLLHRKIDALMTLLGLSPQERSFLAHLAEHPTDRGTIGAFADWLEEQGRQKDAERMRKLP